MPMLNDTHMLITNLSGTEITPGSDITDFRGNPDVFRYVSQAPDAGSGGKIVTDSGRELYPSVFGLRIVRRTPETVPAWLASIIEARKQAAQGERDAVRVLADPLAGPSARYGAERTLVQLGWPKLAIELARVSGAAGRKLASDQSELH